MADVYLTSCDIFDLKLNMAKCLYLYEDAAQLNQVDICCDLDLSFLQENVRLGENLLNVELEKLKETTSDIANLYLAVQHSVDNENLMLDCIQIQDMINASLKGLEAKIIKALDEIIKSNIPNYAKHRYFILLSTDVVDRLKKFLQTVGRLSELDFAIFLEERRKPLISPESTTIHALALIWSNTIIIMDRIREQSKLLFSEEYDFINELDPNKASLHYSKIFLMDMTLVSYILFDRLAKYEELKKGTPFLCPCQNKTYFMVLKRMADMSGKGTDLLVDNLSILLKESWPQTDCLRNQDIVPIEPCIKNSTSENLANFIFWHLYGLSHFSTETNRYLLSGCSSLRYASLNIALKQFISGAEKDFLLSPLQEERFKLIFHIVNWWCGKDTGNRNSQSVTSQGGTEMRLVLELLEFINKNWKPLGEKYLERSSFRIDGLTIFQLLTQMINEMDLNKDEQSISEDQKKLKNAWDCLLDHIKS